MLGKPPESMGTLGDLLKIGEVAALLGLSRQRTQQLMRDPRFPTPDQVDVSGPMWLRTTIESWASKHYWGTNPSTAPGMGER